MRCGDRRMHDTVTTLTTSIEPRRALCGYNCIAPNPVARPARAWSFKKANFQDLGGGDLKDEIAAGGRTVDVHYYANEGHGFVKRENQIDSIRRTIAWFDQYLMGKTAVSGEQTTWN